MAGDNAADAALQNGDVVEAQKLKALGIRNSIEAEIGAVAAAPASAAAAAAAAGITKQCDALAAESRKQKVREVKQQIVEEEEVRRRRNSSMQRYQASHIWRTQARRRSD